MRMAKRGAQSDLNDRNWDDEEEPEEAGVFKQADKETLQQRIMKRAKRRAAGDGNVPPSAFSGFGGLSNTSNSKSSSFAGFGGFGGASGVGAFSLGAGNNVGKDTASPTAGAIPLNGSNGDSGKSGSGDWKGSPAYFSFLKALNQSVLAWIKQHVEENPYIILTPIFKDYQKYLDEQADKNSSSSSALAKEKGDGKTSPALPASVASISTAVKESNEEKKSSGSLFAGKPAETEVKKTDAAKAVAESGVSEATKGFSFGTSSSAFTGTGFSFGSSTTATSPTFSKTGLSFASSTATSTTTASSSGFSFGLKPLTSGAGTLGGGFSFGTSTSSASTAGSNTATTGFSFSAAASQASSSAGATSQNDDEEYVPPKPEVKEIKEDDALYSKRCKLYFQRNDQWVDRGVGNIHLKPVDDTKTQILIRADTNLGNILLNVMLSESMPVSRQGKNNVFLVCVPNPPLDSKATDDDDSQKDAKPVPMLIRVKTGEDADNLFGKIEERKALLS